MLGPDASRAASRSGSTWNGSAIRVFGAFALAAATAVPVGIAMGVSRVARGVFDPPIEFYRPLPPLAYLPLIVIWFGIDEVAKILLIYLACFAPIALAARAGVRSASVEQVNAALSLGASRWQLVRHVIVPAALPEILVGLRIAIGFGWTTLVAAEMVAATVGIGQMVLNASNFLRTDWWWPASWSSAWWPGASTWACAGSRRASCPGKGAAERADAPSLRLRAANKTQRSGSG